MTELEDAIMCMQHCSSEQNIFFTIFPTTCSICGVKLEKCRFLVPPFRVPSPFVVAHRSPCRVFVKPTRGEFLSDFKNGANLHIGIADSKGNIYNYDERGLSADDTGWEQCVPLSFSLEDWKIMDSVLITSLSSEHWTSESRRGRWEYQRALRIKKRYLAVEARPKKNAHQSL